MLDIKTLTSAADGFMRATGISKDVTLSYRIFADSNRLTSLRNGGEITVGRFHMAMMWLAKHWPDGHALPEALESYRAALAADGDEGAAA